MACAYSKTCVFVGKVVRPERFELPTLCFEVLGFENLNALLSVAYERKLF